MAIFLRCLDFKNTITIIITSSTARKTRITAPTDIPNQDTHDQSESKAYKLYVPTTISNGLLEGDSAVVVGTDGIDGTECTAVEASADEPGKRTFHSTM